MGCSDPDRPGGRRSPRGRSFRGERAVLVAARTLHIAAMALVLGGVAWGAPEPALALPVWLTVGSGLVLFGVEQWKSPTYLVQGDGLAVLLKLALLGVGQLLPGTRLGWYLAATAVASVGSHMPRGWRHWSLLHRRELDLYGGPRE